MAVRAGRAGLRGRGRGKKGKFFRREKRKGEGGEAWTSLSHLWLRRKGEGEGGHKERGGQLASGN